MSKEDEMRFQQIVQDAVEAADRIILHGTRGGEETDLFDGGGCPKIR